MRKNQHQRKAYALRRMSRAVDRQIVASPADKQRLAKWVRAWAKVAGIRST